MTEVWAWSSIAPGYLVSSLGNVRKAWDRHFNRPGKLKAKRINENGYETVSLCPYRKTQNVYYVHRLVADAFHAKPANRSIVRHLDGSRSNNVPENLAWGTHSENEQDKALHGTRLIGEALPFALLTEAQVLEIRSMYATGEYTQKQLGEVFGVSRSNIRNILNRYSWRHI